jgi:hypothetical protein
VTPRFTDTTDRNGPQAAVLDGTYKIPAITKAES